ncbi:MAG: NAD(P)/FAD-dependent oxidoreductase [Planctomycetales bacterium]
MPSDGLQASYDVIVAGGGPAGAVSAALIAEFGYSVLLVERESFSRLHVGESLIPAANAVLDRLGMIDEMLASDFPKKYSVQFVTASGHESEPFYFDGFELTGLGHTWQVVRADFDRMLVENATRLGATVVSNTRLRSVSGERPFSRFELTDSDGETAESNCRVFVDATGQSTLIELSICPALQCRLHNAERVEPFRTTKDFSYKCRPGSGDGWVMVGDAYGFIDPVYSSGVFLALKSGEMAADAIHDALMSNDLSAARLGSWRSKYDEGVENFRRLVYAFYDDDFNFGRFLARHPEHRDRLTDVLVGNVFKPGIKSMFADIDGVATSSKSVGTP